MKLKLNQRSDKGITLVALIITIIILVILAAVSIKAVYNSKVVDYAVNGATDYAKESIKENEIMSGTESLTESAAKRVEDILGGKTPDKPLVTTLIEIQGSKVEAVDRLGNAITVPKGFKYKEGEIAEKGIVIEDAEGNQFVWVPVSNTNHDGSNKIKRENGTEAEITLGRYTFNETTGAVNTDIRKYQYAANYTDETVLESYNKELITYQDSNKKYDSTGTNTTAKDLKGFIDSTNANKGYYIARYEASYGSGNSVTNFKPLSKVSTGKSTTNMFYNQGTLWNFVTQPDAAYICQRMYRENVNSDLVNSYAWDTAIIFIQEMEDNDYSIKKDGNGTLRNTGTTGDKACNIFDMGGNIYEWTTETSLYTYNNIAYPCSMRGGYYGYSQIYTSFRFWNGVTNNIGHATSSVDNIGFRPLLYI